eukprot:TRINITY_DN4032_c0_g2_i1.p2 TRINITY_DN4032_c0_g2~~TRINITY_DN4032_c0_g2_i1.p2  ORF type:complete len:214 (-),score=13.15 TRINITY_DN4032_c0_g2_i1:518-1159(-)
MTSSWYSWLFGQQTPTNSQNYDLLQQTYSDEYADLEALNLISCNQIQDNFGHNVAIIFAKSLQSASQTDKEKVFKFVQFKLGQICNKKYVILYVNTHAEKVTYATQKWCYQCCQNLPSQFANNLVSFYVLHCDIWLWSAMLYWCPWIQGEFWSKVRYQNRVEFLWDYFPKGQLVLPEFVLEHDSDLEDQPLMDYGFYKHKEMQLPGMNLQEPL